MMKKQTILWLIVLAIGASLIWFYGVPKGEPRDNIGDVVPTESATPEPSAVVSETPSADQQPVGINKYPPAECQLTGSITFISPTLYENKNANIIYKNIDSVARHIIWTVSPDEELSVGPNLFANLPLPDGIEDVTMSLPDPSAGGPKSKNYILTAKVNYGIFINRDLVIKEASCSGQIPVQIKY